MITLTLTAILAAAGQPGTIWCNAFSAAGNPITIPLAGNYVCWLWVEGGNHGATCRIGDHSLSVEVAEPGVQWIKAGTVTLEAGEVSVALNGGVQMVVLSPVEDFDPKAAMGDRRVNPLPVAVNDRRAQVARHTDTVFTMPQFTDRKTWESRADLLRRRVLLSCGLYPLPEKTPLNAVILPVAEHEDYVIEKVRFEARPGFLVTGNLYRPRGEGPFPATICPHGHWPEGRLADDDTGSVPARCITFARMGIVAFAYDMVGYNDSQQFVHRVVREREKLWGFHRFAMQLWSSMRALDFVSSLPYVDAKRLACTGASGGGTQTFALFAVDPRVKVAAPVNMISSTMQGGCICENAPILRLDNSNMEIGALMAPRPMLMVSATGDWTRETPRVEYPAIRSIYALYGAEKQLETMQVDAGHNYNRQSREAVYRFFGKHLLPEKNWENFTEPPYTVESAKAMRLFPDHADLSAWPDEKTLVARAIEDTRAKWDALLTPLVAGNTAARATFRREQGTVLAEVLGVSTPRINDLRLERRSMEERKGYVIERWIIGRSAVGDAIPALFYRSRGKGPQDAVLLVHGRGKAALADPLQPGPGALVRALIDRGKAVLSIDTFLMGEHNTPARRTERLRIGAFMDTFEPTDTGCRVQDVLTALAFLRARRDITDNLSVAGLEDGGVWTLLATGCGDGAVRTVSDLRGFDFNDDSAWVERFYVPCLRAVGDLRTATALAPDGSVTVVAGPGSATLAALGAEVLETLPDGDALASRL